MADDLDTVASQPLSVESDGHSVTAHPLPARIQEDRYSLAKTARAKKFRGLMFNKLIASGPVSDSQGTGIGGVDFDRPGIV